MVSPLVSGVPGVAQRPSPPRARRREPRSRSPPTTAGRAGSRLSASSGGTRPCHPLPPPSSSLRRPPPSALPASFSRQAVPRTRALSPSRTHTHRATFTLQSPAAARPARPDVRPAPHCPAPGPAAGPRAPRLPPPPPPKLPLNLGLSRPSPGRAGPGRVGPGGLSPPGPARRRGRRRGGRGSRRRCSRSAPRSCE